jgi:hypothetical protein
VILIIMVDMEVGGKRTIRIYHRKWCDSLILKEDNSFYRENTGCSGKWEVVNGNVLLKWTNWDDETVCMGGDKFASDMLGFLGDCPNSGAERVPKIIHFIWIGGPCPAWAKKNIEGWRMNHPDWEIQMWTENDSKLNDVFDDEEWRWFGVLSSPVVKSDILRFAILRKYGGVYIDLDFVCHSPVLNMIPVATEFGFGEKKNTRPECALIISVPDHPFHSWFIWCSQRFWDKLPKDGEIKWDVATVWGMNSFESRVSGFFHHLNLHQPLFYGERRWARTDGKILSISQNFIHGGEGALADHKYAHTWW